MCDRPRLILLGAALLIAIGCGWMYPGCHPSPKERAAQRIADAPQAKRHAIHSECLRASMRELDAWSYERLPPDLQDGAETRRRLRRIVDVADRMARSALRLPEMLDGVKLTESERAEFRDLSTTLHAECNNLIVVARTEDRAGVGAAWDRISATCNACHYQFRDAPPGLAGEHGVSPR